MKNYFGEVKYLFLVINSISTPEIFHGLINRDSYIYDEAEKMYDTEGVKPKGHQSFLN